MYLVFVLFVTTMQMWDKESTQYRRFKSKNVIKKIYTYIFDIWEPVSKLFLKYNITKYL